MKKHHFIYYYISQFLEFVIVVSFKKYNIIIKHIYLNLFEMAEENNVSRASLTIGTFQEDDHCPKVHVCADVSKELA